MWFKNCRTYYLPNGFEALSEELLAKVPFVKCGDFDPKKKGFVPVIEGSEALLHTVNRITIFCMRFQEKILPGNAVKEKLDEKVKAVEEAENRTVGRKERQELKDEVIFSLLPVALLKSSRVYAMFDAETNFLHIDSSSPGCAEDIISELRENAGGLKVRMVQTTVSPIKFLTDTLKETPKGVGKLVTGNDLSLFNPSDKSKVRFSDWDLASEEVATQLNAGLAVSCVTMCWDDRINFQIDGDLVLKKLKFTDVVTDKTLDSNPETKAEAFDSDFAVMSLEIRELFAGIVELLGGRLEEPEGS